MNSVVLDASAVLAVIHRESGFEQVVPHLESGLISAVNYAEVLKKAVENGLELIATRMLLQNFAMNIVPFDQRQAVESARLWPLVRSHGLSFADRACLALAILRSAPVLTGDREMSQVKDLVAIELFR